MTLSHPASLGRAPLGRRDRAVAVAALLIAATVVSLVAWGGLGRNLVYSWGPSELRKAGARAVGATVRLGGLVAEGSVKRTADGVAFELTDAHERVVVRSQGIAPPMFREGIAVVVEGTVRADGSFDGARLMVSHGNEYRPAATGSADRRPR
ncbi:MAG: cytochrome c maturation protein CcmE [Deltaproteobacteria bacterium]|nr:cytochrome c maturation protein CcmE [Deltaproteobacteria bacterium]